MSDTTPEKKTENEESLGRSSLTVPEQIFAPNEDEVSDKTEENKEFDLADTLPEDLSEPKTDPNQITFFDTEISVTEESDEHTGFISEETINKIEARDEQGFDPERPRIVDKIFDFVELFAVTAAVIFVLTSLCFRHAIVDGISMEGTLAHGEHLIISDLFYEPERGDLIVFEDFTLGENLKKPIVKRVIALGGDKVKIDFDGSVYVNGALITEDYKYVNGEYEVRIDHLYATFEEYTVPEDHVFVLGDNRNNSTDSRFFGAIDEDTILGEIKLRILPFSEFGTVD